MEQEIIDTLNLKPTDQHNGQSFMYGITTYDYQGLAYLAECRLDGTPLEDNTVTVYNFSGYFRVSKELLKDAEGRQYLDSRIMRELQLNRHTP